MQKFGPLFSPIRDNDLTLMRQNATTCKLYLNEPKNDASRWIPYITGQKIVFDGPVELDMHYETKMALLQALNDPTKTQEVIELRKQIPFDCLYYGSKTPGGFKHELKIDALFANPLLEVLASDGGSGIFKIKD
jgi:hypothetical protein